MKARTLPLLITGLTAVVLYVGYAVAGYGAIKAMPSTLLIDLSLYPGNLARHWALVPFKKELA